MFVELKKKLDGVVYKRRVSLPLREAKRYLAYEGRPDLDCQILREIDWALARYPLEPKPLSPMTASPSLGGRTPTCASPSTATSAGGTRS